MTRPGSIGCRVPSMELSERQKICELVAGVLHADGVMRDEERAFLDRIYARFNLPPEGRGELKAIRDAGEASASLRALPDELKRRVMALLIEAAVVDTIVHPAERTFLLIAAAALGIDADVVETRITKRLGSLPDMGPQSNPGG